MERALGLRLPVDYRIFLLRIGCMRWSTFCVNGVTGSQPQFRDLDVVRATQRARSRYGLGADDVLLGPIEGVQLAVLRCRFGSRVFALCTLSGLSIPHPQGPTFSDWLFNGLPADKA